MMLGTDFNDDDRVFLQRTKNNLLMNCDIYQKNKK